MTIPSIAHKITVGIDGETVYTSEYVYQYDNASDFFEVTVSGVADLLIFAEHITVSYELMRDGQRICGTEEYPCSVLLASGAITKVICVIPADIRKNAGFWCGQIHIYEGEYRRSTDVFVFKTLPGMRPSEQIEGKPSNAERYFGSIGFGLKARLMNATRQLAACDESFCIAEDLTAYADQSQLFTFDSDVILGNSDDAVVVNKGFGNFDGKIGFEATDPKPVSSGFGDFDGEIGLEATDPLPVTSGFGEIEDNIALKDVSKGRYALSERLPPFHISARTDETYRAYTASAGDTSGADTSFGSAEESTAYTAQGQAAEYEESAPIKLEATATVVNPQPMSYISTGFYISRTDIQEPIDPIDIALPVLYWNADETTYSTTGFKVFFTTEYGFDDYILRLGSDDLGLYMNHLHEFMLFVGQEPQTGLTGFEVTATTAVTAEEYDIFYRYFRIYP